MTPVTHLNYPIDKDRLLALAESVKHLADPYTDSRYPGLELDSWLILEYTDDYIDEIMKDLGVNGSPRFYWKQPNFSLPMHVDNNTTCSINFVLTDNPAPVKVEDSEYTYEQAILNTTRLHGVGAEDQERILLKISIFDESYEDLVNRIPYINGD